MLKFLAYLTSVVFHPLLMVTYMLLLLMWVNPYLFGIPSVMAPQSMELLLRIFILSFFLPGFAIVMMRLLGFVQSVELKNQQERIAPYIVAGIFYIWLFYNLLKAGNVIPRVYTSFVLGATIALFLSFLINIFSKISAHAVGMGGMVGMVVITMLFFSHGTFHFNVGASHWEVNMIGVLIATIVLAGIVGTARLLLSAHEPMDLYGGYLVGFSAQMFALQFLF